MKQLKGFTIIEIAVVITVLAVLATITVSAYSIIQRQARDTKRNTDLRVMKSGLEKFYDANGEYPSSCPQGEYNTTTQLCTSRPLAFFIPSSGTPLNSTTTKSTISSIIGVNLDQVGDPKQTTTNILGQAGDLFTNSTYYYLYVGSMTNPQAGTVTNVEPFQLNINGRSCSYQVTVPSGSQTSFILAYYGESDNLIHLVPGDKGVRPHIPVGAACVIDS